LSILPMAKERKQRQRSAEAMLASALEARRLGKASAAAVSFREACEHGPFDWPLRFCCMNGLSNLLTEARAKAGSRELEFFSEVAKDETARPWHRTLALVTLGSLQRLADDIDGATQSFSSVAKLEHTIEAVDRGRCETTIDSATGRYLHPRVGTIWDKLLCDARNGIDDLRDGRDKRKLCMALLRPSSVPARSNGASPCCSCCGGCIDESGAFLRTCQRCKRSWYCSQVARRETFPYHLCIDGLPPLPQFKTTCNHTPSAPLWRCGSC